MISPPASGLLYRFHEAAYGGSGSEPVPKQVYMEHAQSGTSFSKFEVHNFPQDLESLIGSPQEHNLSYPICASHGLHPTPTSDLPLPGYCRASSMSSFLLIPS